MATVEDRTTTSSLSNEAYDLISCFYGGVDDVVYQIAEGLARRRNPPVAGAQQPLKIEIQDVREAGRLVVRALRNAIRSEELDPRIVERFERMTERFDEQNGDAS